MCRVHWRCVAGKAHLMCRDATQDPSVDQTTDQGCISGPQTPTLNARFLCAIMWVKKLAWPSVAVGEAWAEARLR